MTGEPGTCACGHEYDEHAPRGGQCLVGERMTWDNVIELVNTQAEDPGLWFVAETAIEAYLQQELRRLHAAIEDAAPREGT